MGIYSDQIASRLQNDQNAFEAGLVRLSSVITGRKAIAGISSKDGLSISGAMGEILDYYNIEYKELPEDIDGSGMLRRLVELSGCWYKDGAGPLLGQTKNGQFIALIPKKTSGYTYFCREKNRRVKVSAKNAGQIGTDAYFFYNPLPLKQIGLKDLFRYMMRALAVSDFLIIVFAALAAALLGLIMPYANLQIFGHVIPAGEISLLVSVSSLLLGGAVSAMLVKVIQNVVHARIVTKAEISVQSAAMARLLSLPAAFFKEYSSGEIAQRALSLNSLCGILIQVLFGTGIVSLFSLIYIWQIAVTVPALAVPAFTVIMLNIIISILNALMSVNISKKQMEGAAKLNGLVFSLISGLQKIKVSGGERRAFARWADRYSENAALSFAPPFFIRIAKVLTATLSMAGTVALFAVASSANVSVAEYMSFSVSYGLVSGSLMFFSSSAVTWASIKPMSEMAKPLLDAIPESSAGKKTISRFSGAVDINNISFRYNDDMPMVLDDFSLKITRGQYVAIVGASGCGKSTLIRLLLGFEEPIKGAVYYDSHDIKSIDLKSLRRSIGCVVQNGTLMPGSIFDNITISAPWLGMEEAWAAAETAGVAEDIRGMAMGMHTIIPEGGGGLSGGQKQRLLIARAIAPKPKILILDEATSALDNITQKHVSKSLDSLKCTRIVIAHRLSTIRQCDRVIMLENGKIAEEGTYDGLMALNGKFAELVERQRLDG